MVLVSDGGFGTEVERRGVKLNDDTLWAAKLVLDDPELVEQIHYDFYVAGCDIATTCSYQFSFEGFEARGIGREEAAKLLRKSITLADNARKRATVTGRSTLLVAASLGSYGAVMSNGAEFTGIFDKDEEGLVQFHAERLQALMADKEIQPDWIAFETVPCLVEVKAILRVLEESDIDLSKQRVWLSLSCKSDGLLNSGEEVEKAAALIGQSKHVELMGFNCLSPTFVHGLVTKAVPLLNGKGMIVYPNRGEAFVDREWKQESGTSDEEFLALASQWLTEEKAIVIVGGCCRMTVDAMSKLAQHVKSQSQEAI